MYLLLSYQFEAPHTESASLCYLEMRLPFPLDLFQQGKHTVQHDQIPVGLQYPCLLLTPEYNALVVCDLALPLPRSD